MNTTNTIVHVDVADVTVRFHCTHDDGTASFKVCHDDNAVTVYLCGSAEQLGTFAEAVARATARWAIAEVEAATNGRTT
jgi:hypothetical protein